MDSNQNLYFDQCSAVIGSDSSSNMHSFNYEMEKPIERQQANARERYRTHSVNSAFITLRQLIPTEPKTRKLSKIETLRLAKSYIEHLAAILMTGISIQPCMYIGGQCRTDANEQSRCVASRNICTFCVASKSHS